MKALSSADFQREVQKVPLVQQVIAQGTPFWACIPFVQKTFLKAPLNSRKEKETVFLTSYHFSSVLPSPPEH